MEKIYSLSAERYEIMVNEEKVILMTKLASYESHEGKKDIPIINYFKGDYIGFQVLKSVIAGTLSFFALFGVYIFYNFNFNMLPVYFMFLLYFLRSIHFHSLCKSSIL